MGRRTRAQVGAIALAAMLVMATGACSGDSDDASGTTASSTTAAKGGAKSGALSVLSYNVAGLPAEISKEQPDVNIPLISPKLEPYDVVLTQEDFDWWKDDGLAAGLDFTNYHDRLRADTTHEYATGKHPGPEAVGLDVSTRPELEIGDGLGVLSRYPIDNTVRVPWTGCFGGFDTNDGGAADCLAMKGFMLTQLELPNGMEVDVYNLHGEAGGTETDQILQADDYQQLAEFIEEHSEDRAIILGGDTNLHTDLEHEDAADGADLQIWESFLKATGLTDACAATECDDPSRIDKFAFRSGGGVELEATSYGFQTDEFVDDAGEALSDHEALAVDFAWSTS